ncbi:hypothetical protein BDV12DRAFT_181091 [Aspergillus spectabilis]
MTSAVLISLASDPPLRLAKSVVIRTCLGRLVQLQLRYEMKPENVVSPGLRSHARPRNLQAQHLHQLHQIQLQQVLHHRQQGLRQQALLYGAPRDPGAAQYLNQRNTHPQSVSDLLISRWHQVP